MGGKKLGFSDYELTTAKKQTKREKFLSEMEAVVPWQALIDLIEPHYLNASQTSVSIGLQSEDLLVAAVVFPQRSTSP